MFQRELLYAAGGQAASGWPRHWGERGVLPARRGCVRAGGQDNVCGRLQPPDRSARRAGDRHIPPANAQKRKGEPGRTGKKRPAGPSKNSPAGLGNRPKIPPGHG